MYCGTKLLPEMVHSIGSPLNVGSVSLRSLTCCECDVLSLELLVSRVVGSVAQASYSLEK